MRGPTAIHFEMALRQTLDAGPGLSAFLSKLSILGMIIAVSLLLGALSVMNGFEREMRERILDLVPHVTVRGYVSDTEVPRVTAILQSGPGVKRYHEFRDFNVLFSGAGDAQVARLALADLSTIDALEGRLRPQVRSLASDELVLGASLAQRLGLKQGDPVFAVIAASGARDGFMPASFQLAAILDSETEIDRVFALADPVGFSEILGSGSRAWALSLYDPLEARAVAQHLRRSLSPQYWVSDWTASQGNLYQAIQLSRQIVGLMLTALLAVAVFNVVTSLVLVTSDRAPATAMLRAMGATPNDVLMIFTIQGTIIGVGGALLGAGLGALLAVLIPSVVGIIESVSGQGLLDTSVYPLAYVPIDLRLRDFVLVPGAAFVLSVLACAIPAMRASQAPLITALRETR